MIFDGATEEGLRFYGKGNSASQQKTLLKDDPLVDMTIHNIFFSGAKNSQLTATIDLFFERDAVIDYAVVTIESDAAIPVAQSMPNNLPCIVKRGANCLNLSISNLALASGHYYLSVLVSTDTGKRMLGNLLFGASFDVIGGTALWCPYQPEVSLT